MFGRNLEKGRTPSNSDNYCSCCFNHCCLVYLSWGRAIIFRVYKNVSNDGSYLKDNDIEDIGFKSHQRGEYCRITTMAMD